MKNYLIKLLSVSAAIIVLCAALAGCVLQPPTNPNSAQKLPAPEVEVGVDGTAVWSEVHDILYYAYIVDDGEETPTLDRSLALEDGQTIKVKAVSSSADYVDSDWSQPKTYHKNADVGEHDHTDVNSDGICDKCEQSVMANLTFYAVNDLHGKFMDTSAQPGVDEFTTWLKQLYADDEREEILLSSGDMWQGTVESSSNRGQLMTEWMNDVGFVSMTLGNHEYDWGDNVLTPNSQLADFPFLAINVTSYGQPAEYCQPSVVVERAGIKIGIIGAIGDCLSSISGDMKDGLEFATGSQLTSLVKAEAERLRTEEGCSFIVYSVHNGGSGFSTSSINEVTDSQMSWYESSLSNGYVDLVFEGHTHNRYILKDEYNVYHLQGGGENGYLSSAQVSFNTVTQEFTVNPRIISNREYAASSIQPDPIVENLYNEYFSESDPYNTVLGRISAQNSTTICDQVAKLYYERGVKEWGDQYKIVLGGGFLQLRNPYKLNAGNVTYADIFSILPFDNEIVLGRISGSNLKKKFINSTNDSYHIYSTISASEVNDNSQYYIIVDSYTSTYRSNNITEVARLGEGTYSRDLLAEFIKEGGWSSSRSVLNAIYGTFSGVPQALLCADKGEYCR